MNLSILKNIRKSVFKTRQPTENGFSLIELLVALAVFSIVVALIVSARIRGQDQELTQQQAVEMQQTARSALLLMSKDIRMAGYDPDNDFSTGITAAGDGTPGSTLDLAYGAFEDSDGSRYDADSTDNDGDGQTDEANELGLRTVSYQLQDNGGDGDMDLTVLKGGGGGYHLLAENIPSLEFAYLDEDGNPIAAPAGQLDDIRAVRITITAGVDSQELDRFPENNTRTLTTTVKCRNLGL